ncbi:hypothetical protein GCM10011375_39380 [Hymenobacter qilianensis]|uniref:Uncharacterized protein n=2 Tax=Hymenobacter qilianensis TaxID=1385715 RepID=A0ACB5PX56_9BACT|nr:hypothetical protein [Hymenobacter qilianensis]QNP54416.1 hypothetical protein H9L05_21825 [Hymenobacter qilianensis]GGF80396.1 hypothetical protein GCM10011375_39380 [Hymenobacter qilianensis]
MLFIDQVRAQDALLSPEFERLFSLAVENQSHPGDLLLVLENGAYQPEVLDFPGENLSPYVIGPGADGLAYNTHYQFINLYRQRVYATTHSEYLAEIEALVQAQNWPERDKLEEAEAISVQLETLIYLKVWESDFVIKRLYEFVRVLFGESFEWRFKVSESARDRDATGVRHEIIRLQIRDKVRPISEILYTSIVTAYKTQIRNSIAHSNYSIMSRNIHPNNYVATDPASQLYNLPFDDWIDMFHTTLAVYNELIGLGNKIRRHYATLAAIQNNEIQVLVPDRNGQLQSRIIMYRPEWDDFTYRH